MWDSDVTPTLYVFLFQAQKHPTINGHSQVRIKEPHTSA